MKIQPPPKPEPSKKMQENTPQPAAAPSVNSAVEKEQMEESGFTLDWQPKDLLQGIVFSEILGKPRCYRRR